MRSLGEELFNTAYDLIVYRSIEPSAKLGQFGVRSELHRQGLNPHLLDISKRVGSPSGRPLLEEGNNLLFCRHISLPIHIF